MGRPPGPVTRAVTVAVSPTFSAAGTTDTSRFGVAHDPSRLTVGVGFSTGVTTLVGDGVDVGLGVDVGTGVAVGLGVAVGSRVGVEMGARVETGAWVTAGAACNWIGGNVGRMAVWVAETPQAAKAAAMAATSAANRKLLLILILRSVPGALRRPD